MTPTSLTQIASDVPSLQGVLITAMPDCLMFDAYLPSNTTWTPESVASYFGDLVRANREALKSMDNWSSDMQVTIESSESLIILKEVQEQFVIGFIFNLGTPIGMVRLHVQKMLRNIEQMLASFQADPEEAPRAVRIIDYLQRYAPDPHASLMRLALKTGIPIDSLNEPHLLSEEYLGSIEIAVQEILGLSELHI